MPLFILYLPIIVSANQFIDELAKRINGEYWIYMNIISSKATDPIGIEGLWGLKGDFVVDNNCQNAFDAIADVPGSSNYSEKNEEVNLIEKNGKGYHCRLYRRGLWVSNHLKIAVEPQI